METFTEINLCPYCKKEIETSEELASFYSHNCLAKNLVKNNSIKKLDQAIANLELFAKTLEK